MITDGTECACLLTAAVTVNYVCVSVPRPTGSVGLELELALKLELVLELVLAGSLAGWWPACLLARWLSSPHSCAKMERPRRRRRDSVLTILLVIRQPLAPRRLLAPGSLSRCIAITIQDPSRLHA